MFREQAVRKPDATALQFGGRVWSYGDLLRRVDRVSRHLLNNGVGHGARIAILSENRPEYTQLQLAAGRIGAIVACLNWRLAPAELSHCVALVEPALLMSSARFADVAGGLSAHADRTVSLDDFFGDLPPDEDMIEPPPVDAEDGLLLLYTSGTTGLPKAALISHRAAIARMCVLRMDLKIEAGDTYLAWSPMYHMGGTEHTLSSLMFGSPVIITDGLDLNALVNAIESHALGWLLLVPATIEPLLAALRERMTRVRGVKVVGCMADLVPASVIADITTALNAPFLNSFGSTETGLPPATGHLIAVGAPPGDLSKRLSSLCELRLVDANDLDVAPGEPGEAIVRGPTLFSGYWNAPETNIKEFRGGWFHMGDLFRLTPAGNYDFIGRSKYLIKSGGENIYPAEIERVLLADPRIAEAAVVRMRDPSWGEIPVAFVARNTDELNEGDIEVLCRANLAGYKRPKMVRFIDFDDFPRNATGKIIREELERRLE